MSLKIKFENATLEVPNSWDEVKVGHFIKPEFLTGDVVGLLAVLVGVEKHELMNSTENIEQDLYKMAQFYIDNPVGYRENKMKPFKINGKTITIPKDIELERLGQRILFASVMGKYKFAYEAIPEAVAIYLIPSLTEDGSFDDSMIDQVAEAIKEARIVDVFPVADFFLNSLRSSPKSGNPSSMASQAPTPHSMSITNSQQEQD